MIVVGVTGNLASGKSEAVKIFKKLGAKVFDADVAAKQAVKKGKPAYQAILKIFGRQYLGKSGELDRKKLAWRVFSNPKDLKKLNILIHPGVIFESLKLIERLRKKKGVLVLDVPLLFESKMAELADCTVVVSTRKQKMIARAAKKGLPAGLAKKILSTQWPLSKKEHLADFVIKNNGTTAQLEKEVRWVLNKIQSIH